jgi:hypothetical protein
MDWFTIRVIHNYTECLQVEVVDVFAQCVFIAQLGFRRKCTLAERGKAICMPHAGFYYNRRVVLQRGYTIL